MTGKNVNLGVQTWGGEREKKYPKVLVLKKNATESYFHLAKLSQVGVGERNKYSRTQETYKGGKKR